MAHVTGGHQADPDPKCSGCRFVAMLTAHRALTEVDAECALCIDQSTRYLFPSRLVVA